MHAHPKARSHYVRRPIIWVQSVRRSRNTRGPAACTEVTFTTPPASEAVPVMATAPPRWKEGKEAPLYGQHNEVLLPTLYTVGLLSPD
ncbi:hypothetical protein AAFF_G00147200 [Aldrovandia affinis]|uniref:Uncharacterized protein n=1 Tax=Aldrovandia affinis TaxID=143900 RepID=A0AAD7RQ54_9TELE|nr:hypothetical protein AAFF_G00147200 [Aldrovandia affinis]